jgi:hypothetical protein
VWVSQQVKNRDYLKEKPKEKIYHKMGVHLSTIAKL